MELLAKNQITVTKALFLEADLRISRDGYGKSARRAMLIFLGLWAAFLGYTLQVKESIPQALGLLAFVGLIGWWLCVYLPRSHAKRAWKAQEAAYGSDIERTTEFFEDHLRVSGDGVEKTIGYKDVLEIRQSRHLLILLCRDKVGVILDLQGFLTGSAETVITRIDNAKKENES